MAIAETPRAESIEEIREQLEYDSESDEYRVRVDLIAVRPSVAVMVVAAAIRGVDETALPSIDDSLYTKGMNDMLRLASGAMTLRFEYAALSWTVQGSGWVVASESASASEVSGSC